MLTILAQPFVSSLFCDLFWQPQVIMMSISGLFLEQGPRTNQPLRSFNRVFVIVPFGGGFCIINEQLFVTNATEEQSKVSLYVLIRIYDWPVVEH